MVSLNVLVCLVTLSYSSSLNYMEYHVSQMENPLLILIYFSVSNIGVPTSNVVGLPSGLSRSIVLAYIMETTAGKG